MAERCFLPSMRLRFWALGTLVARRGTGLTAAWRIRSNIRSCASARLRSWARWLWAMMTMMPSFVSRLPASRINRTATSLGSDGEPRTSKRSCTADETLLTFCPPGPDERTKFSMSSASSTEMVSVTGTSMALAARQVFLRQHFAFFHCRLIEGVEAEEVRGDDGLQHEMHQQFAQRRLVELGQVKSAHRATVLGERLGGGARFRRHQIADGLAGKVGLAGDLGEVGIHAGPKPCAGDADDGEEFIARPAEIELHLAVL